MKPLLLVGAGGFFGAIARYLVGHFVSGRLGAAWPYGTFLINLSGCFLIGLLLASLTRPGVDEAWRYLLPIGFVGAYTTFSTYAYETVQLVENGAGLRAFAYVTASTVFGYGAVLLGVGAAKRF